MTPEQFLASHLVSQLRESAALIASLFGHHAVLVAIAQRLEACLRQEWTLYLSGNGGSSADAQRMTPEFVGRYPRERRPLPAIALTCNTTILPAIGNGFDYSELFARPVPADVTTKDCVIRTSTSGLSANVLKALAAARETEAVTIGLTGNDGHELASLCDDCLLAPSRGTPRIQEAHLLASHLICDLVELGIVESDMPTPARPLPPRS
jgi:D-sedoheptulose 7-phosphate isomerase